MPEPELTIDKAIEGAVNSLLMCQFGTNRPDDHLVDAILLALREIQSLKTRVRDLQVEVETLRGDVDGLSYPN